MFIFFGFRPWSDAVMEYLHEQYNVTFSAGSYFKHERAAERFNHIGRVLLLPVRSFSLASAGYTLKAHHSLDEVFVRHGFKGSWKRAKVSQDGNNAIADTAWAAPKLEETCMDIGDRFRLHICGRASSPPAESFDKLFDGAKSTKWLSWAGFKMEVRLR